MAVPRSRFPAYPPNLPEGLQLYLEAIRKELEVLGVSGGASIRVEESDAVVSTSANVLDFFGADFNLVQDPVGEVNINIDGAIARTNTIQTWTATQNFAAITASSGVFGTDPGGSETVRIGTTLRVGNTTGPVAGAVVISSSAASGADIIQGAGGRIDNRWIDTAATANERRWELSVDGVGGAKSFSFLTRDDAGAAGTQWLRAFRTANAVDRVEIATSAVQLFLDTAAFYPNSGVPTLGTSSFRWGKLWGEDANFSNAAATVGIFGTSTTASLALSGQAANIRDFLFQTNGVSRWVIRANATAEAGADAGSDLQFLARDDAGALIDSPITITRAAGGSISLVRPLTTSNVISTTGAGTLRLADPVDLSLSSTGHALQIGATNALNLAMDANEIMARSNGAASPLVLNQEGGSVTINGAIASGGVSSSLTIGGGSGQIIAIRTDVGAGGTRELFGPELVNSTAGGATGPIIRLKRARGTGFGASRAAVESGDELMAIGGQGFTGSAYANAGYMLVVATETWSPTANGGEIIFQTVTNATTGVQTRWRLTHDGHWYAQTTNAYDIGASGSNKPRDLFLARNADIDGTLDVLGVATLRSTLNFTTAASKIIPGATNISLRNNADTADNLIITDAGVAKFRNAVQIVRAGGEPSLRFERDLANNPRWEIGRMSSTTFRFIYADDVTTEFSALDIANSGVLSGRDNTGVSRWSLGSSGAATGFELGRQDGTGSSAFIDFHTGATAVDYDTRVLGSGGTGSIAGGTLDFIGATVRYQSTSGNTRATFTDTLHTFSVPLSITGGKLLVDGTDSTLASGEMGLAENAGELWIGARSVVRVLVDDDNSATGSFAVQKGTQASPTTLLTLSLSGVMDFATNDIALQRGGVTKLTSTTTLTNSTQDFAVNVLGTFDNTGTRFTSGTGPVADDVMSWHGGAQKWRPRFLQTQFSNGVVFAQNNTDGTFANFAFSVTYNDLTPSVPATPIVTPIYGGFIIDMGALPPSGSSYVVDYKVNAGSYTTNRIIFTSQKMVHTVLSNNGGQPFSSSDTFTYKAKGRGSADGSHDSVYSSESTAASYLVTTEVNAFGLVLASQITAVYLSAITANIGSITAGQLVSGDGTSILQLDSTFSVPGTVTKGIFFASANPVGGGITGMYIDFTATGTNPLFHHTNFDILANGSVVMKGVLRDANSKFVIDVGATVNRLMTIIDEQGTPRTRVKVGEINTGTADWGIQVFDNTGTIIVDMQASNLLIQDAAVKFKADFTNALLTVTDNQGSPTTRVKLGKIGGGTTDYGIQVFSTGGGTIVDMQASNLLIQDAAVKFKIDFTNRLLSVIDEQGSPITRIKIGEISTGTADWGMEIYSDNGNKIVQMTGTAMFLQDSAATPTQGLNIKGTVPGTWTRYVNLNGSGAFAKHERLEINYDGSVKMYSSASQPLFNLTSADFYLQNDAATPRQGILLMGTKPAGWRRFLDLVEGLLSITDEQGSPILRVKVGKVGAGSTDYGLQVFDSASATIMDFTGAKRILAVPVQPSSDSGTSISVDLSTGLTQQVRLTGTATVTLTNPVNGGRYRVWFQQDTSGSRPFPTMKGPNGEVFMYTNDTPPTLTTTPGALDLFEFEYRTDPTTRFTVMPLQTNVLLPSPVVQTLLTQAFSSSTTTHNVTMPSTVDAGDLLIVIFAIASGSVTVTTPSGWTEIAQQASQGAARAYVIAKYADGSEDSTNVDFVTSSAIRAAAHVYRITKHYADSLTGAIDVATANGAASTTPDPPSNTTTWAVDRTLWIAAECHTSNSLATAYPTNYSVGQNSTASGGGSPECVLSSARRAPLYAATENPASFTISASQTWATFTMAIRPPA